MPVQDKVAAVAFTQETGLSPEQIRQAGQRAAEAARRFMTTTLSEAGSGDSSITYVAKGPGGLVKQMVITVGWTENGDGRRTVRLAVGDYITIQSKFLMLIPTGPKQAPALPSARRFAEALRAELAAA